MKLRNVQRALGFSLIAFLSSCRVSDEFYSNLHRNDVFVQQNADSQYDFLWVLDNSGSMSPRREYIKDNIQTFINILNSRKAIDFQMAVTTTDMKSHMGQLVTSASLVKVVKSASSVDPAADFAGIVDAVVDSPTSFWEQGLESAYQAITLYQSEFSRPGVPLIVIFVTDEEDYSCESNCTGIEPENNTDDVVYSLDRYTEFFSNLKVDEGTSAYIFPIVGLSTSACAVASLGDRYVQLQEAVAGLGTSGSICTSELQQSYENIAQIIADRGMVFPLSSRSKTTGIRVYVDNTFIPYSSDNFVFDTESNSIVFTGFIPRNGSTIEVLYSQNMD